MSDSPRPQRPVEHAATGGLDVARLVGVLMIVGFHAFAPIGEDASAGTALFVVQGVLLSGLGLLLLLSGFVHALNPEAGSGRWLVRRLAGIAGLLIAWSVLYVVFSRFTSAPQPLDAASIASYLALGRAWPHLWYLPVLFVCTLAVWTAERMRVPVGVTFALAIGAAALYFALLAGSAIPDDVLYRTPLVWLVFYVAGHTLARMAGTALRFRPLRDVPVGALGSACIVWQAAGGPAAAYYAGLLLLGFVGLVVFSGLRAERSAVRAWTSPALGVYLVHPMIIAVLGRFAAGLTRPVWGLVAMWVLAAALSMVVSVLLHALPFTRGLVGLPSSRSGRIRHGNATVTIVQTTLTQYRVPFFELLRGLLRERGVTLQLLYGRPLGADASKADCVQLEWAHEVSTHSFSVFGRRFVWQAVLPALRGSDLVIVEQANKLLVNYLLLLQQRLGVRRVAFWGHGRNFQAREGSRLSERVKRSLSRSVHWWFAYNDRSKAVVESLGYPAERISSVQNAIDTRSLADLADRFTGEERTSIRKRLGIPADAFCAVYVGGMYPDKRLEFLIAACDLAREKLGDFHVLAIGAGESAGVVQEAAESREWLHYLGPVFGDEKGRLVLSADVMIMPGLVGLAVLDALALRVPLVTTDIDYHSPEIAYLVDGYNGLIVGDSGSPLAYAEALVGLAADRQALQRLVDGCAESRSRYTVEEMAERFCQGVCDALEAPPLRLRRRRGDQSEMRPDTMETADRRLERPCR